MAWARGGGGAAAVVRGALERERKRERKGWPIRNIGLGARDHGDKLGAKIYDAELTAKSAPRLRRAQDLGASNGGAEKCKLGASNDGTELRV